VTPRKAAIRCLLWVSRGLSSVSLRLTGYAGALINRERWAYLSGVAQQAAADGNDDDTVLDEVFKAQGIEVVVEHGTVTPKYVGTVNFADADSTTGWDFFKVPEGAVADFPVLYGAAPRSHYTPSQYDEGIARLVEKYGVQIIVIPDSDGKAHSVCAPEARC
jgi:hypothetical protein